MSWMYNIVIAKALFTKNTLSCKQQVILILHDNDNPYFVSFGFTAYIFEVIYGINDGQNRRWQSFNTPKDYIELIQECLNLIRIKNQLTTHICKLLILEATNMFDPTISSYILHWTYNINLRNYILMILMFNSKSLKCIEDFLICLFWLGLTK